MKRAFVLASLFLAGCGGPPKPVPLDAVASAQEIVDGKSLPSAHLLADFNYYHARRLLEDEQYAELDAFLDRLAKTDPIESLSSPVAIVLRLTEIQREADALPWLLHYSDQWVRQQPRGWAQLACIVALTHRGDSLMDVCGQKHYPVWEQGQQYFQQGTQFASQLNSKAKGWPYLDFLQRLRRDKSAITQAIRAHPQEVGLYQALGNIWMSRTREQRLEILKDLKSISPSSYALFFTFHLPISTKGKILAEGWDWPVLASGFEQLLKEHPKAMGVRNAYAVAGDLFSDSKVVQQQLAALGNQWDTYYWETPAKYQSASAQLPDYHMSQPHCPVPTSDPETVKNPTPEAKAALSQELFQKRQWGIIENLAAKSPDNWKDSLFEACEQPSREHQFYYTQQENNLREWQSQYPDSPFMMACMGAFYVNYGSFARGTGYANTVTAEGWSKLESRLQSGQKFIQDAYRQGPHHPKVLSALLAFYLFKPPGREVVDKLALEAARMGNSGYSTLSSYAYYLLPRWHGEPGDVARAADWLRSQTGNDDAYAPLAGRVLAAERPKAFEPGNPAGMSWERWARSLETAGKAGRLNPLAAYEFIECAMFFNHPQLAQRVAPYVPVTAEAWKGRSRLGFYALRNCALKGSRSPWAPNPVRYSASTPRVQSLKKQPHIGFLGTLDHSPLLGGHYVMEVDCPEKRADDGTVYKRFTLFLDMLPGGSTALPCYLEGSEPGDLLPGVYNVALLQDHKVLHEEKFTLTP
ncbi:MAG: hypothetical protein J0I12_16370 [Candidatus Eremiobacteraeota bacterium]|nr:hypothetical protein [Candidatus Eremiobacteraeota bacterium]